MIRIRGGSGLGDAVYLRVVADHLVAQGHEVTACCDYPMMFSGSAARVEPFTRSRIDRLAHYAQGKSRPDTTQWQDVCASAGVPDIPFSLAWERRGNKPAWLRSRANGRPVILVHGGRAPMGRTDGFGAELLPQERAFRRALEALSDCMLVGVGNAAPLYRLAVEVDLNGSTSVADLLDLAQDCDGIVAQCSFAVPLAEVFDKPLLAIWSARGLASRISYVSAITPRKVLSKPMSLHVVDTASREEIEERVRAFRALQ